MTPTAPEGWTGRWNGHEVHIGFPTARLLRVAIAAREKLAACRSYAVDPSSHWDDVPVKRETNGGHVRLRTPGINAEWNGAEGSLVIRDASGVARVSARIAAVDGVFTLRLVRGAKECVYGLGEAGETFEKSGLKLSLWNTDDPAHHPLQNYYCQIPFTIHLPVDAAPYGLFVENPGRLEYDLAFADPAQNVVRTRTGDLILWFLIEQDIPRLVTEYTHMTGRMDRPPLWALGYHQCRWSYYPESRVREVADEFRRRRIPCDVIYLDIDYMDGYRVFSWDPVRFPDPGGLIADLRRDGFRVVTIVDPGVKIDPEYAVYSELLEQEGAFLKRRGNKDFFTGEVWPGKVHFPDFTNAELCSTWGRYQKESLLDFGVAGIWNDMNEPAEFIHRAVPNDLVHADGGAKRTHEEIHQVYGLTMAAASRRGMLDADPDGRPFVITRSGWAGVQRHAMVWTGDNQSVWRSMPFCIQLNLNMGLCGIPFVGCDIGGFSYEGRRELFERWIEWGVFQPYVRTHSAAGTVDQEPWSFGEGTEEVARRMIEWRMRLLPHLYTLFVEAAEAGAPINRPLIYQYGDDPECRHIGDQFLVGSDLLVAPILEPGMSRRLAYLPRGAWYDFWTGELTGGGRWTIAEAQPGRPPVWARAGSVIPLGPVRQHTGEGEVEEIEWLVFPGLSVGGRLVEDDGLTRAWERGASSTTLLKGDDRPDGLHLTISEPAGDYRSRRLRWRIRLVGVDCHGGVEVDGRTVSATMEGLSLTWVVEDHRKPVRMRVLPADGS